VCYSKITLWNATGYEKSPLAEQFRTPTETKIARLVADGRSNPEIAAELLLSRNTVLTHVSHILGKFGARSRMEIAASAAGDPDRPRGH